VRPVIAITTSEILRSGTEWAPLVHGQSGTYTDAVIRAGGTPFLIPIFDDKEILRQLYDMCSGLLLSGGGDIDPQQYGSEPIVSLQNLSPLRDKQEALLIKWAVTDNRPVLGICRGMQMINVGLGGNLHQDILAGVPGSQDHEASVNQKDFDHMPHKLIIETDSKLASILGVKKIKTNALHHQAINKLGKGLKAVAHAEDGIIEAIELPGKNFVIGVQSHPESLQALAEPLWFKLFEEFVRESA
jgi:putative glutamine amidotransferase